MIFTEF